MTIAKEIIDFIRKNRVSTTEVADALDKTGVMPDLLPINENVHKVGTVRTIFTNDGSNYEIHDEIRHTQEGEIVLVFTEKCNGKAIFGDLVAKFALFYLGAEALVVDGAVRDVARLQREQYPIWSKSITPLGCHNNPTESFPKNKADAIRDKYDGGIAICDSGGVTVIPSNQVNADMLRRLRLIELQEDIWYYCLNTLKWDTKSIVCDKRYLKEKHMLPEKYQHDLDLLQD